MRLAHERPPRKPFYLDRDLSIAAQGGGLRVQVGDEASSSAERRSHAVARGACPPRWDASRATGSRHGRATCRPPRARARWCSCVVRGRRATACIIQPSAARSVQPRAPRRCTTPRTSEGRPRTRAWCCRVSRSRESCPCAPRERRALRARSSPRRCRRRCDQRDNRTYRGCRAARSAEGRGRSARSFGVVLGVVFLAIGIVFVTEILIEGILDVLVAVDLFVVDDLAVSLLVVVFAGGEEIEELLDVVARPRVGRPDLADADLRRERASPRLADSGDLCGFGGADEVSRTEGPLDLPRTPPPPLSLPAAPSTSSPRAPPARRPPLLSRSARRPRRAASPL